MKKTLTFAALLLGILFFCSCEKTEVNSWERFYGFTQADVIGHYDANPDSSYYEPLPTEGVIVYPNATIDITPIDDNLVRLVLNIPDVIYKIFTGAAVYNENDSDMTFHDYNYDILMTVYKNPQNQIRLHGRERYCRYNDEGELINCTFHGFDVIKASTK